jgi:glyoxylase-like metal-dependent hydrolase (beta-lactamase superfamily II)
MPTVPLGGTVSDPVTTVQKQWAIGDVRVTIVVESQTDHIPPELFFTDASAEAVASHQWLVPDFADDQGRIGLSVQAFVVETPTRIVVVDPCVGNGKTLEMPFWNEQRWPFWERFEAAGFSADDVDLVVHTHLHADHVGWDTRLVHETWVPTFAGARHLYTEAALAWLRDPGGYDNTNVLAQSVQPILDAGLGDMVDERADLGEGLRLAPSNGHTPGHVSLWIESDDQTALLTGDFFHHPVQCAVPEWAEVGDSDPDEARATRRRMLDEAATTRALVFGTHFPTRPVGRIVADRGAWRFIPE